MNITFSDKEEPMADPVPSDVPAFYPSTSLRLYAELEKIGASTSIRGSIIESSKIQEILGSVLSFLPAVESKFSINVFGSAYEGTKTYGMYSDVDQVAVFDVPVVSNDAELVGKQRLLMFRDESTPPGYVKLRAVESDKLQQPFLKQKEQVPDQNDKLYDFVTETVVDIHRMRVIKLNERNIPTRLFGKRHGPAFKINDGLVSWEQDTVFAFRQKGMPTFFEEWCTRNRPFGWPTKQLVESCKALGCLFVHVGHRRSEEWDLLWRISFSFQERLLVTSFNSVQHKCFILLKMIKKEIIQKQIKYESISSYHCKTCMLYMVENTKAKFWRPHNLLKCLASCMKLLLLWLKQGNCPNYFIPEENMFDGKISCQTREKVVQLINTILESEFQCVTSIRIDNLGQNLLRACLPPLSNYCQADSIDEINKMLKLTMYTSDVWSILGVGNSIISQNFDIDPETYVDNLSCTIRRFRATESMLGYTTQEIQRAMNLILPYLEVSLISNGLALKIAQGETDCEILQQYLATDLWNIVCEHASITSRLKQATYLYVRGYFSASLDILQSLERCRFLSVCYCDVRNAVYPDVDALFAAIPDGQPVTLEYHLNKLLAPCVAFLPPEAEVLPVPLLYERFRAIETVNKPESTPFEEYYSWVIVDAQALFHLLLYLNHKK